MVPSTVFSGRECRHADKIFAFPARTEFSVTTGIAEAIQENNSWWVSRLCRQAAAFARSIGDRQRQIHYEEQVNGPQNCRIRLHAAIGK
jgi:hypothetical protein